jgi:GTP pyrophosphokinase
VYTFTPKGKVIPLARGSTPVDFAYAVHTEVGHQCVGAKVNGQIVPLRHVLANGDVVEVLTQRGHEPSRDWLNFVASSKARSKIRHWLNLEEQKEATDVGRRLVEQEARSFGVSLKRIKEEAWRRVAAEYGCAGLDDLYAGLGYGKWSARQVLEKASGETLIEKPPEQPPSLVTAFKRALGIRDAAILVRGHDDLLAYRAKCCNPIRGDEIVGYITRGRGVAVHNKNCPNVQKLLYQSERRIPVEWTGSDAATFPVRLLIRAEDKPGILASITAAISEAKCNIRTLETAPERLHARIEIALEIADRRQLERLTAIIKKLPGIFEVERLFRA